MKDPVREAFENAPPRTRPLSPAMRAQRDLGLAALASGQTISQKTIDAILWLQKLGYRVTKESE